MTGRRVRVLIVEYILQLRVQQGVRQMIRPQELVFFLIHTLQSFCLVGCDFPFLPQFISEMEEELVSAIQNPFVGVWDDIMHGCQLVETFPLED